MVYKVKDMINGEVEQIHATRLILYRDNRKGKPVSKKLSNYAIHIEANYEVIKEILDVKEHNGSIWFKLRWLGIPARKVKHGSISSGLQRTYLECWKNI